MFDNHRSAPGTGRTAAPGERTAKSHRGGWARWAPPSVVVLLVSLLGVVAVGSPAQAALPSCSGPALRFDGFYTDNAPQTGIEGVSANMVVRGAALCPTTSDPGNTSSSWVMIAEGETHRSVRGLAQIGVAESPQHPTPTYFWESGANDAGMPVFWHTVPAGSTHRFWVQWVSNGCGAVAACFAFNVDTTRLAVSNFDPYAYWGSPWAAGSQWDMQILGEVHDLATDIMGDNHGSATVFSNVQAQDASSDQYRSFTCNLGNPSLSGTRYGLNYPSSHGCGAWSIYTIAEA
jgi:hypothetical protein